jgi:uncharacterized protein (DUF488 family)
MVNFDLLSIGHSNIPAERFLAMLRAAGVHAIADVRSAPVSRFCPWFSAKNLAPLLARDGMSYLAYGDVLGGRPRDAKLYRGGIADYETMARQPEFGAGLARLMADAARCRAKGAICLMCSEREPLECHRCLLLARALAERKLTIGHILFDGSIEPHTATERRLLALDGGGGDLFAPGQHERLTAAYRRRARAVAYRARASKKLPDRSGARAKAES